MISLTTFVLELINYTPNLKLCDSHRGGVASLLQQSNPKPPPPLPSSNLQLIPANEHHSLILCLTSISLPLLQAIPFSQAPPLPRLSVAFTSSTPSSSSPPSSCAFLQQPNLALNSSESETKMVSQRQRLAKKRFKEANPELFPKPDPTPPKDPDKKKKKKKFKSKSIKRKSDGSEQLSVSKKPFKSSYRKHPLRVPGMKPGDTCFICKAADHIAKSCPQKAEWEKNKICLRCRRRGHRAKNCPEVQDGAKDDKYCYNCGETGHSLANCPHPLQEGGTKFAECFVCKQQGHLSKNCPQNAHGIYPKGGCCKICGGVTHLARDCPDKGKKAPFAANGPADGSMRLRREQRPCGTVTKFTSGDDIEDDFMTDDMNSGDKDKSSKSKDGQVKPKKGPKVVNF
ncbi:hypothetical protein PIB30_006008 [Stylosanthes scabra]|uniref:CCHC-type domain-containing protein n=1 Tax=Stylosanthes scabra TaxID=79078 RepID=A0ABU6T4Z8_9FABA|nr:hypothetical protein [Stylosanthes scabra]